MSNFYCSNIQNNLRIDGSNSIGIRILPCCVYQTDNVYSTLEDYDSSEEIANLKKSTEWPIGCSICKHQESIGQRSYRIDANNFWNTNTGNRVEAFPSNVCNLKCMMCDRESSTAVAHEQYSIGESSINYVDEFEIVDETIDIISKFNNVRHVSLIGGEFFLAKKNLEFLDFITEQELSLRVVTNATVILNQHLEKLKMIKDLDLQISIDGYEQSYEFMRFPSTWDNFSQNVARIIQELPKANINFHFVVQPLNVLHLVPTLHWINQRRIESRITNLTVPDYLTWEILKPSEKLQISAVLNAQLDQKYLLTIQQKNFIQDLCSTINNSQYSLQHRNRFIDMFTKTMSQRKISVHQIKEHLGTLETITRI